MCANGWLRTDIALGRSGLFYSSCSTDTNNVCREATKKRQRETKAYRNSTG